MEQELLQFIGVFVGGMVAGIIIMLILNKLSSGSASPSAVKQEFDEYQNEVEKHFEETSKKFKDMTEQYQGLYKHLSVGATSLCRPDSVAAALADQTSPIQETSKLEDATATPSPKSEKAADSEKVEKAKLEKVRLEAKLENAKLARAKNEKAEPQQDKSGVATDSAKKDAGDQSA